MMGRLPKYNIGDRVMAIPFNNYFGGYLPGEATIMYVSSIGSYAIEFDEYVNGHDCEGYCKDGHGFWLNESDIALCESDLPSPTVGDTSLLFGG